MLNNEILDRYNIPNANQWVANEFLFDKFMALKDCPAQGKRAIIEAISKKLSSHTHKAALLEHYSKLFLNDANIKIWLSDVNRQLSDDEINAIANDLKAKLLDKEGQLGTEEKIAAKRKTLFEYQAFYEKQKDLYKYFSPYNENELDHNTWKQKFEDRMQYLSANYSSYVELEKDDVGHLFYSTCAWVLNNNREKGTQTSPEELRYQAEFLGFELSFFENRERKTLQTLTEEQKLSVLKKLQANRPIMITLTNGAHHVSVQILKDKVNDIYAVHLFDGMSPLSSSYAKSWASDLNKFLKDQYGNEKVKPNVIDEHYYSQSSVNCGLTSAIGGAYVIASHLKSTALSKQKTFESLNELSKFVSESDWNKIPFILNEQIFTAGQALTEHKYNLCTDIYLFFAETQARVELLRMLHSIRNATLKENSSIPALVGFKETPSYSTFELFLRCLFSESFFRKELVEYADFAYAYKTAADTKQSVSVDEDTDVDYKTQKPQASTSVQVQKATPDFLKTIYDSRLIAILDSPNNESSFLTSAASQFILALLCLAATAVVFKNDLSFTSLSKSFSR